MKTTDDILDQLHRLKTQTEWAIRRVQDGLLSGISKPRKDDCHFLVGDFYVLDLTEIQQNARKQYEQP